MTLENVNWKEFRVGDLLKVEQTKSVVAKVNLTEGDIPYVSRTTSNNGYQRYCGNIEKLNKGHCITIGAETAKAFYQPKDFVAGNKIYRLSYEGLNEKQYLFLATALNKNSDIYSYSYARIPERIKDEIIKLPATQTGDPDWEFMEDYISEIEKEYLEKIDRFFIETGLDDYELTDEDKKVLRAFENIGWEEFRIGDLFELERPKRVLSKRQIKDSGKFPAFSSDTRNGGILGYVDEPDMIISDGCRVIFGDHTRAMNITRESFSVLDNVKILKPFKENISDEQLLFIFTCWKKVIPDWGYARHWKWAKSENFLLPVREDGQPDWEFMEKYIKVIEKITIKDAVEWKNEELKVLAQNIN